MRQAPLPKPREYYDVGWANQLVGALDRYFSSLLGDLVVSGELVGTSGRSCKLTAVTSATYSISRADDILDVNFAGGVTLTLPGTTLLTSGKRWYIQDSSGAASTNVITITAPSGVDINGGASITLTTNYGRIGIVWNGTQFIGA